MLFDKINQEIIIGLAIFQFVWLLLLSLFLIKAVRHYRRLIGKSKKQDLKKIMETILSKIKKQEEDTEDLQRHYLQLEKKGLRHLQKIGFLRFNPFSDTGGDQSFVLSFLDAEENGVILSSLHSRGTTRIYAKTVKKGVGHNFKLSREEKEAIQKARRRKS